jgi:hypothetical protein
MKAKISFIKILALAGLYFGFMFSANAALNEQVKIYLLPQKKVLLVVSNPALKKANLVITEGESHQSLYTERVRKDSVYRRVFDLSSLPEGRYTLSVDFNQKVFEKELELMDDRTALINESVSYPPVFNAKNNLLTISYKNPLREDVSVSFLDGYTSFFTDVVSGDLKAFQRAYNLMYLEPGSYEVELVSGNKNYTYSFVVR